MVRCFDDENIMREQNRDADFVDPLADIDTINLELILADLDSINKRILAWLKWRKQKIKKRWKN